MTAASIETAPKPSQADIALACELAEERYTAARRQYTHLYVDSQDMTGPPAHSAAEMAAAWQRTVDLAARLREVEDGEPEAVRRELEAGRIPEEERALTTDRFTIAELRRAAAAPAASWTWTA